MRRLWPRNEFIRNRRSGMREVVIVDAVRTAIGKKKRGALKRPSGRFACSGAAGACRPERDRCQSS